MYHWECSKCGLCCAESISNTSLCKFGITLLPHEVKLFPKRYIKPAYGIGKKGRSRPRPVVIIAYQNISEPCCHYDEKTRLCRIYEKRPTVCREFPLEGGIGHIMLHRECPEIAKIIPEDARLTLADITGLDNEIKAIKLSSFYFFSVYIANVFNVDTSYSWYYNYQNGTWMRMDMEAIEKLGIPHKIEVRVR